MTLTTHELQFLDASAELALRQAELEPLVSAALGRSAYDYWILGHGCGDPALELIHLTEGGEWQFYFHGLEMDIRHVVDGRSVRVDFGPRGILTFTPEGVGGFVQQACAPWRAFPELAAHLAGPVGYDYARCLRLSDALRSKGLIRYVAPEMVELMSRRGASIPGRDSEPPILTATDPPDEMDLVLCDKLVLTPSGRSLLAASAPDRGH